MESGRPLAPGYQAFDPSALSTFGYGRIPDVVTGLEYDGC